MACDMHVPFMSSARCYRIEDTSVDQFTGLVCKKWHVIPHFEALKSFYNESGLLFLVNHSGRHVFFSIVGP